MGFRVDLAKPLHFVTGETNDAEQFYQTLEKVLHQAISFARNEWGWAPYIENYFPKANERRFFQRPTIAKSEKLLLHFLRATARYDTKKVLSNNGSMYCTMVKLMYALFQLENRQVRDFISLSDSINLAASKGVMVQSTQEYAIEPLFTEVGQHADAKYKGKQVAFNIPHDLAIHYMPTGKPIMREQRGKVEESALIKLLQPRGTVDSVIKDGLGIRYVCDRDDMPFVIETEISWLHRYYGVESVLIENEGMYSRRTISTLDELTEYLRSSSHLQQIATIERKEGDLNMASSDKFKALKVLIKLKGENKYVEIQLLTPATYRSSEQGEQRHEIYEAARVITGQVRVLGYLTDITYKHCIEKAVRDMYPGEHTAEKYKKLQDYVKDQLGKRGIRKKTLENKQVVAFVHERVFLRWLELGFITPEACANAIKQTKKLREQRRNTKMGKNNED